MIQFLKTRDKTNEHDHTNVAIDVPHNDASLDEIVEAFQDFLLACGYRFPENQHLDFVEED